MASKDLTTIDQALGSTEVLAYLKDPASVDVRAYQADPEEVRARIEAQVLSAGSLAELLGGQEVISGKGYVNKPFQIRSVEWQASDIEGDGLPFYAVMDAVDYEGTFLTITCGARSVVQKLAIMQANVWLPAWAKLAESTTAGGYTVLDLVAAPEPFPAA